MNELQPALAQPGYLWKRKESCLGCSTTQHAPLTPAHIYYVVCLVLIPITRLMWLGPPTKAGISDQLMIMQHCTWSWLTDTCQSFCPHVLFSEQLVRHHASHVRFVGTIREPIFQLKCAKTWFFPIFWHIRWDMTWWWPQMCSKSMKNMFFISPRL